MRSPFALPALAIATALLPACSRPPAPDHATVEAAAAARLQAIPAADPGRYQSKADLKNWRNPYVIIRADGLRLLDAANNEQRRVKPEELLDVLAQLPSSSWPYGRVVGVEQPGPGGSEQADVEIRRLRGIVSGTLDEAKILIEWIPSA
jgi:hypothetical protein